jgi:hypothetical protein
MDSELLVGDRARQGRTLLAELSRDPGIDLPIAFWVKPNGVGYWSFYLASAALKSTEIGEAFVLINKALNRIDRPHIGLSEIKIVAPTDPIALGAIEMINTQLDHWEGPLSVYGGNFGDLLIDVAYIYPNPGGSLNREQVVRKVVALMIHPGTSIPSSITLRDGRSIQAVPTGIMRIAPGGLQILLHETGGDSDLSISADDVVRIN